MRRSVRCVLILALCLALSLSGALVRSSAVRAAGTDTWTAVYTGLHSTVQALAIDPLTPAILYAGTSGGVFRSTNSGTMSADQTVTGVFQADALPDLTVDTLYFLPVQPTPGGSVTLYFTIHNQGAAPVTADYVMSLYGDGVLWETGTNDDRLTSGASQGWHWPITWPSDTASHTFMVVLDPGNVITESNESNNSASISASASGTAPSITVTSPTDGTVWSVGETRSITWTVSGSPSGIAYFLLGYNVDGGSNYPPLDNVSTAPSTATSYNWIIPNAPSSQCSIVVLAMDSYDNPMFGGFSSGLFTISSAAYTLTTTASPAGAGSIGRSPNAASYAAGTVVTLTANANPGYHFVNWSGNLTGTTNPTTITMSTNRSVTAVFQADPLPDLTVDTLYFEPAQPTPGGSVTFNFTIRNQGAAPVIANYDSETFIDGVRRSGHTDTDGLAAGASENWQSTVTWPSDTASHTFMVVLDPAGVIAESNEANNSASLSASAALMSGALTDSAKVLTLNYFNPVPVPPTAGTPVALASQYIYKMGDVIHGTVTFGSVVAGQLYTVQLKNMNGTVVDTVNGYQVAGLTTYPIQIGTANVSFDGPYDVVVGDANESISLPVGKHVFIQYNLTWMTNTIGTSGTSTIQGWVTRANGQTVLSAVTVGIAYPDNTLAASYVVAAQSSEQFSLTFPVNPAIQIGSYRVFIRDGYAPATIPDNDAMIYRMLSNGPDADSNTLVLLASWNLVSVSVPLPVSSIPGLQAVYGYHDGWSAPPTLLLGGGYWVQVQNAVTVLLSGTPLTAPVSITYQAGWQLLGNPFDVPVPISSITNHGLITTCYSYGSSWGILNPATDSLQPGKGYWIYLSSPTTLTLTHP
ncbi:MAG TPA: CARDB domain-containing protein [Candidatus Cryosericum sp.]